MSSKITTYKIHVTKEEFDDYLYPSFVSVGSKNDSESEIAVRNAKAFREGPTVKEELTAADEAGKTRTVAMLLLIVPEYTFIVEGDMFNQLKSRYKKYMGQLRDVVIIEKVEFRDKLEKSEKLEIDPESASTAQPQQAS